MKKVITLIYLMSFFLWTNCSHQKTNTSYYFEGNALGTTYHIKAFADKNTQKLSQQDIDNVILEINNSLSTYQANSLISKINKGKIVKADTYFKDVYMAAKKIFDETNGLYDPSIGILVNAWGFGPGKKIKGIEKDSSIVDSLMKYVNYNYVTIDEQGFVRKKYPQVFIDYNSIAKGYAVDCIGKMLEKKGFQNFLVEIGGEVLTKGKNLKKNKAWLIAIDNPNRKKENKFISKIELSNQAMATSGNYRKYYIDEKTGVKYVHTIDPKTGYPAVRKLLSVTIITKNCTLADGYATACMVLGIENCKKFLKKHPELQAFLVYSDEQGNIKVYTTDQLKIID